LLDLIYHGLTACIGLTGAAVFKFDHGNLDPRPVAEGGTGSRLPPGPATHEQASTPLRTRGKDVGLLSLSGARLVTLRPESLFQLAQSLAVALCSHLDAEEH